MNRGLKHKDFIVRPEQNMVIARLNTHRCVGVLEEVLKKCSKETGEVVSGWGYFGNLYDKYCDFREKEIKGVAKCDAVDEFDPEMGAEIAESKVDLKYHDAMYRKYRRIIKALNKAASELCELAEFHENKANKIKKSMERYL